MRRTLAALLTTGVIGVLAVVAAAPSLASTQTSGSFSGFAGKVSCHWTRTSSVTTVRCWSLAHPGTNDAVSTGDKSGRIAHTMWKPPVGPAMIFNHKYNLGNGVTCAYRWRHVTDTVVVKSVQCATSAGGPLIFTSPSGVSANLSP